MSGVLETCEGCVLSAPRIRNCMRRIPSYYLCGKRWMRARIETKNRALCVALVHGLGQPHKATALEAVQSFLTIICAVILADHYGLVGVALAWLIGTSVSQGVSVEFTRRILHRPFRGLGAPIAAIGQV